MSKRKFAPHPSEYLAQLLRGYELMQYQLAEHMGINPEIISRIMGGKRRRAVDPDLAIALEQAFGISAEFWLHTQAMYELRAWKQKNPIRRIGRLDPPKLFQGPSCFDRCLCGHWGWHHQNYPDGPCLEEFCECEVYKNLGDVVKKTTKELGYTENKEKWR